MARPKEKEVVIDTLGRKHTWKLDKKTGKKLTGRPCRIDEEKIQQLERLFEDDVSIEDACAFVGIAVQTYYNERERNPQFLERMDRARAFLSITASKTIAKAVKEGDVQSAKRFKEKRDDNYKQKPAQINMQQGIDPETGEAIQGLMVEFTIKD